MSTASVRRFNTGKRIQVAAVTLAIKNKLSNVTTEEISLAAGVSPRTFFNYYPYKEAALIGPAMDYPEEAVAAFIASKGNLLEDLQQLMTLYLSRFKDERELMNNTFKLSETEPKLQALLNNQTLIRRDRMNEILGVRLPDALPDMIHILSSAIIAATNKSIRQWACGKCDDFLQASRDSLALILPAAELLRQD